MRRKTDTIGRKEIRMRVDRVRAGAGAFFLAIVLAFAYPALPVSGQEAERVFAPFASRLRADPLDYQVKLSWHDAPDTTGTYLVYRSQREITSASLGSALLVGKVDAGVQYFLDTPPEGGSWYYAVLLQTPGGTLFPQLIQYRNMTSAPVTPARQAPEEDLAARVSGLSAVVTPSADSVQVSFRSSNPGRDLLLFRGTVPLLAPEDLLRSVSVTQLDPGTTRYVLPALSGVDYWFAVLDAGLYKIGQAPLEKGVNTSAQPVQVPMASGRISLAPPSLVRRALPLPSLQITHGVQSGLPLAGSKAYDSPVETPISAATEKSIAVLRREVPRAAERQLRPQVLASDTTPVPGGQLQRLREIVTGPFLGGDMTGAQKMLLDYLSLPRSREIAARARFYLGQTYFIEGRRRDALLEFLLAQDAFYQETRPWLDASLDALAKADR
jgi:hypothetical protein